MSATTFPWPPDPYTADRMYSLTRPAAFRATAGVDDEDIGGRQQVEELILRKTLVDGDGSSSREFFQDSNDLETSGISVGVGRHDVRIEGQDRVQGPAVQNSRAGSVLCRWMLHDQNERLLWIQSMRLQHLVEGGSSAVEDQIDTR